MRTILAGLILLLSCSRVGYKKQDECSTTEDKDNLIITCSDNIIRIPKVRGLKGDRGSRGPGGYTGETGAAGANGANGSTGADGVAGKGCSVAATATGAVISCEDGTSAVINNGADGVDGQNGTDGVNGQDGADGADGVDGQNGTDGVNGQDSITEVINPCGIEGGFEEVLFRLSNGRIYALYFSGSLSFLTELTPGNYQTTDNHNCSFTVHADLSVTW